MKTSLIISTYNSPRYLELNLRSLLRQTQMPDEIVIADDGSTEETQQLIDFFRSKLPPIKHVWHEDKGFRKALIMNKGFAACEGDYIIHIDGDLILEKHFIEDHLYFARPGYFVAGSRALLKESAAKDVLDKGDIDISIFKKGLQHRLNLLRCRLLAPIFFLETHSRGCNMAFWLKDILNINGYDERMMGVGLEDTDLDERLIRSGIKRQHLKMCAICTHIWHKTRELSTTNNSLLEENRKLQIIYIENGISKHTRT